MMTFYFNPMIENATEEQKWAQIRAWRNAQLNRTDWTQLADSPLDKEAWAIYRQALRDLPAQGGKAEDAVFPIAP
jgi:hypothetical protein